MNELEAKEEAWRNLEVRMKKMENKLENNTLNKLSNKVVLDVGGTKFTTSKSTL